LTDEEMERVVQREILRARQVLRRDLEKKGGANADPGSDVRVETDTTETAGGSEVGGGDAGKPPAPPKKPPAEPAPARRGVWWGEET
jgi:hypothetical protein